MSLGVFLVLLFTEMILVVDAGNLIQSQIVPIPVSVREIHNRFSVALKELVFLAKAVPANGYRSYFIEVDPNDVGSTIPEVVLIRKPREPSKQTVIRSGVSILCPSIVTFRKLKESFCHRNWI